MRRVFCVLMVLLLICSSGWAAKPYKRAMYFNGGGLNFAKFVGMYYGAKDAKKEPDLVIGICGGSLAASIVSKFETQEEALEFLTSPEMHQMFLNIGTTRWAKTRNAAGLFVGLFYKKLFKSQRRAGIKDKYIMDVPQKLGIKEFETTLDTGRLGIIIPTTIVLGTRNGKLPKKKKDWKFQPVYYTDTKTAEHLKRLNLLRTFLKNDYPKAPIMDNVICKTGVKFEDAFRGSISDPFLMSPHDYDGYLHLTGAMDASPLEMIDGLAEETFFLSSRLFNPMVVMFFADAFLFDPNFRYVKQEMLKEGKWAYYLDIMDCPGKYNLTPGFSSLKEGIRSTCPKDYHEFKKIILWQFELGYKTTRDAIANKGSTSHLKYNFYKELKGRKYRRYADKLKEWLGNRNSDRR